MKIFAGLTPSPRSEALNETLTEAARAVVSRLRSLKEPRSLCEIATDAEDYGWLTEWAKSLRARRVERWLDGVNSRRVALQSDGINLTYAESFGCLFLLLASETARRESNEGRVWASVRKPYPRYVESALFVQGQPRDILKDAMESTARKLRLRHVYGQEGTQEYYLSVYLQFGFTRRGFSSRLPEWLAGQGTPETAQRLLGVGGDRLESESFVKLWDTLRNFRKNNITKASARASIDGSAWTLAEWTDELLKQARAKPEIVDILDIKQSSNIEEQPPPGFLSAPKLRWSPPSAPEFVCEIENLADLDLTSDRYLIQSGGAPLGRLFRAEDGGYRAQPEEITFAPDSPHCIASLMDDFGDSPASQAVELWEPMVDVEAFDLHTGSRIDAWGNFTNGREYGLLLSEDLDVQPCDMAFHAIGSSKKLCRFRADSSNPVKVFLEDEELWSSERMVKPSPQPAYEPDWAKSVNVGIEPSNRVKLSESTARSLRVYGLGHETDLAYVRVGAEPLDFSENEYGDRVTSDFDVLPFCLHGTSMEVRLGLRNGLRRVNITRTLTLTAEGVLRLSENGWRAVQPSEPLSAADAKRYAYRILPPPSDRRDLALMEGPTFLRRLWTRPRPLESIGGYGDSLGVRAPYNWIENDDLLTLSHEARDGGVVEAALSDGAGILRLRLAQPLEPGPKHSVALWAPGEQPVILNAAQSVTHPDCDLKIWDAPLLQYDGDYMFTAIAYDGARIGATWPAYPHGLSYVDESGALQTAAMLRWMRAPIVSDNWIRSVQQFAYTHPSLVLKAWLEERGLSKSLSHGVSGEQWTSAVRKIFSEWSPNPNNAAVSIMRVGYDKGLDREQVISQAFQKLMRLDPILMGRVACAAMMKYRGIRNVVQQTRLHVAALPPDATGFDIDNRENELLTEASERMNVDAFFLRSIAKNATDDFDFASLSAVQKRNAETALGIAPFREYLGLKALNALATMK